MSTPQDTIRGQIPFSAEADGLFLPPFAFQHLRAASTFRDQAVLIELQNAGQPYGPFFEDMRSYVSGCIMSTAASMEAHINECFLNPNGALRNKLQNFEIEFFLGIKEEKKAIVWFSTLEKYKEALKLLGGDEIASTKAFQEARALIGLRDAFVHYKPNWGPAFTGENNIAEALKGKYPLSPFAGAGDDFVTMKSMSSGCARWVIATARTFIKEFHARANLGDHKMTAFWELGP